MKALLLILLAATTLGAGPIAAQDDFEEFDEFDEFEEEYTQEVVTVSDPLYAVNQMMFDINDRLYFMVIKPLARSYRKVTPEPARISLKNFFSNLATPGRFANCLLQGKGTEANTEFRRFLMNSTVGLLGLADPAKDKGLIQTNEDLGQTLAKYGIGNGIYMVFPFLGPSTLRDSVGRLGDSMTNPIVYVKHTETYLVLALTRSANEHSFRLGDYEALKEDMVDPYTAMRDAYIQYRQQQIKE